MLVNLYSFYYVFVAYLELVLVLLCTCIHVTIANVCMKHFMLLILVHIIVV